MVRSIIRLTPRVRNYLSEQNSCFANCETPVRIKMQLSDKRITVSLVAAMDPARVIGMGNQLPWHLPADLKHFKAITLGKPILMGRKTFDSIGKVLPGRRNMVLSAQPTFQYPGVERFGSLQEVVETLDFGAELLIIGGGRLFADSLSVADKMYLTWIEHYFKGDVFFPKWDDQAWEITKKETHQKDALNPFDYSFVELRRIA